MPLRPEHCGGRAAGVTQNLTHAKGTDTDTDTNLDRDKDADTCMYVLYMSVYLSICLSVCLSIRKIHSLHSSFLISQTTIVVFKINSSFIFVQNYYLTILKLLE